MKHCMDDLDWVRERKDALRQRILDLYPDPRYQAARRAAISALEIMERREAELVAG